MSTSVSNIRVQTSGVGGSPDGQGSGGPNQPNDAQDWPPGYSRDDAMEPHKYRIGVWVMLVSVAMLFMALTSAYIWVQAKRTSWAGLEPPSMLWATTAIIVLSSITFELARRRLRQNEYASFAGWIGVTTGLGVLFVIGQLIAWQQLVAQGLYVNTNPHSSFFYLLTSLHGVHLLGGILAVGYLAVAAVRNRISIRKRNATEAVAVYWHFMGVLWIYLFVLLFYV